MSAKNFFNNFIWADLSTYNVSISQRFYAKLFGWNYSAEGLGDESYFFAKKKQKYLTGLYEMPPKFAAMKMPSFWMSYIAVSDLSECVRKAQILGGKLEFSSTESAEWKYALVRDPSGAGFTIYECSFAMGRDLLAGKKYQHELYVSNPKRVIPFYESLFLWEIKATEYGYIVSSHGDRIATIKTLPPNERYQYWACIFELSDFEKGLTWIQASGGKILAQATQMFWVQDPGGAFFGIKKAQYEGTGA